MNGFPNDFFWRVGRHFLDVHAPFAAGHHDWLGGRTVQQDGEVIFVRDVDRFRNQHLADMFAGLTCLFRDQRLT